MSVPASLRVGPFIPTILPRRRYLLLYFFIVWVSTLCIILELWLYWPLVHSKPVQFWVFLPLLCFIMYLTLVFSSLVAAKFLLMIVNLIHKPREGLFLRHLSDKDYRYWCIRNTIKRWPVWLSHRFTFPFLDNICFKMFGVKTKYTNSLFEGWVDTEFIEFGDEVVVGQASIVQSAVVMGNFLIIRKTIIEDNVRIGAHCVVMPGTHIGKNCILGSNSTTIVEQELDEGWVYIGTPAKKYKKNRFFEEGLEEILEKSHVDIDELRMKYEENYFQRHDEHVGLRDKLKMHKELQKDEQRRMDSTQKDDNE